MVAMSAVYDRVAAPPVTPHRFGLFAVAPPSSPAGTSYLAGIQWETWACLDPNTTTDPCINGGAVVVKEFEVCPDTNSHKPITVYQGMQASGGQRLATSQAEGVLQGAEEYAVEKWLWADLSTRVTENAALSPLGALAFVEDDLATHYHGEGVVHMTRGMATRLAASLVRSGSRVETMAGTPVAVGAGYAAANPNTIYGTGAMVIYRGPVAVDTRWNLSINDELTLAERTYVVGWDCFETGALVAPAT
jgi:hypothetical protein